MLRVKSSLAMIAMVIVPSFSMADETTQPDIQKLKAEYVRPAFIPSPESNKITTAKVELGHKLYFDPRLSKNGAMSCATCHNPALGWEDGLSTGLGHKGNKLGRHSPTILNLAWASSLFWDGRAANLEEQAKGPMLADAEMGMTEQLVLDKVKNIKGYQELFAKAFPGEKITLNSVAKAIASFERTIISGEARFDKWIKGDEKALTKSEKNGFRLYNTKAQCATCHAGWRFTDDGFHDIGLKSEDLGRGKIIKGVEVLKHAFKTPTLRNIDQRAPFMHDGSIKTLDEVIRHYENGFVKRKSLSWAMKEFSLTDQERSDLLAFLKTLSSNDTVKVPVLPQ